MMRYVPEQVKFGVQQEAPHRLIKKKSERNLMPLCQYNCNGVEALEKAFQGRVITGLA